MASKAKTWGQRRGYPAGNKTVAELRPPRGRYVVKATKSAPAKSGKRAA